MAAAARENYPNFDFYKPIFGLSYSQHSVFRSRKVLEHYNKYARTRDRKPELFMKLAALEKEVPKAEAKAIKEYVEDGPSGRTLYDLIGEVKNKKRKLEDEVQTPVQHSHKNARLQLRDEYGNEPPMFVTDKECTVCMEKIDANDFPRYALTKLCEHEPTICRSCVKQSIETQIPDVIGEQVKCPECPATLPHDVLKGVGLSRSVRKVFIRHSISRPFSKNMCQV